MKFEYTPRGVCARKIEFEINEDGIIKDVEFSGGCAGNAVGIAKLVEGMRADEVIEKLEDIRCGGKPSSCPAQLALALKAAK